MSDICSSTYLFHAYFVFFFTFMWPTDSYLHSCFVLCYSKFCISIFDENVRLKVASANVRMGKHLCIMDGKKSYDCAHSKNEISKDI